MCYCHYLSQFGRHPTRGKAQHQSSYPAKKHADPDECADYPFRARGPCSPDHNRKDQSDVDTDDLKSALADFIPPYYPTEIDLQNLVAVLECTSRSLLPQKYREMERSELIRQLNELSLASRQSQRE